MGSLVSIKLPDIGDFEDVEVVEVMVKPGDRVRVDDSLITIESDKASMEVPATEAGVVKELKVKVGDRVSEGSPIIVVETTDDAAEAAKPAPQRPNVAESAAPPRASSAPLRLESVPPKAASQPPREIPRLAAAATSHDQASEVASDARKPHASPAVRKFAR